VSEIARLLGVTRATVYRDLAAIRRRGLDRIMEDPTAEEAAIQAELNELDSLFHRARRDLEERTEPGTREWAAGIRSLVELKKLKLHAAAELGVYRKAPQRHTLLDGDELANLEGEALDDYLARLQEAEDRMLRVGRRGRSN